MNHEIGSRVGEYEILAVLGAGGMGQVYKVRNVISDRLEAMKVLLPNLEGNPDLADRFIREIKVQASLDHPNIAALHTAQRVENQLLMLMEFVEGTTLAGLLKNGALPPDQVVDYVAQILSALSYAHSRGIIHRDVKPANIILTPQGVVKLMDFGIAKLAVDQRLTKTGFTVGSLYYMSPEQIKGALDLDPRSDLYSLGVVLYEMLTGGPPFKGDSDYSVMAAHLEKMPAPLFEVDPSVPPLLSEITLKALEKDPAKRFQSADAFRRALTSVKPSQEPAPAPVAAAPPQAVPVAAPVAAQKSHRGLYMALGSVLTILILVLAAMQIPKYRRTSAESVSPRTDVSAPPQAEPQPQATQPPQAVQEDAIAPPAQAPPQSARTTTVPPPQTRPAVQKAVPAPVSGPPAVKSQVRQEEAPPAEQAEQRVPAQAAVPPPAAEAKTTALLEDTRDQFVLLATRATAAKGSIENLRRRQEASGLGLRADIAAGLQRMEYYLDECEAALKKGDAAAGKKNLDAAERETSKLEGFLGH